MKSLLLSFFVLPSLLLCSLFSPLLFGSSPVNAFELTSDVWRVSFSSDPQFRVVIDGSTYGWTNTPFFAGSNSNIQRIDIRGNKDSTTVNGWTWKAQDFFSIDLAFYSSAQGCNNEWPGSLQWHQNDLEVIQSHLVGSYNNAEICYTQWNIIINTWSAGSGTISLYPENMVTNNGSNYGILVSSLSQWRSRSTGASTGTGEYDQAMLEQLQKSAEYQKQTLDATNKIQQQQQQQYEQDKKEESDRENQGQEDADKAKGIFNFNVLNPFEPLFKLFSPNQCVSIPTLASMVGSEETQYCSWFSQSTRSILTPAFGIVSIMLLFGFVVRWLGGSNVIKFVG